MADVPGYVYFFGGLVLGCIIGAAGVAGLIEYGIRVAFR